MELSKTKLIENLAFWQILDCHKVSRLNLQTTIKDPQILEATDFIIDEVKERKN
jgi:hypothetical protein